jgi:6-phosphogluconolactonase (cycloisomerase 2 family)
MSKLFRLSSTSRTMLRALTIVAGIVIGSVFMMAASSPSYIITNDDISGNGVQNSVTFYTVGTDGQLSSPRQVFAGVTGAAGGFFPPNRVLAMNNGTNQCVFVADAATGGVGSISVKTLTLVGGAHGSSGDAGLSNGMGLAFNSKFLYASYTDSNTIGTFEILSGCGLTFVSDISVVGLQSGVIDGMAVHGNVMITTYGDGSIESFDLSAGVPVSSGDKQNSTGSRMGNSYPSGIDITQDGHFAIFGDTSTSTMIEVSDISSGKLTPTLVYKTPSSVSSSNIMLSPDETMLFVSNTQGDQISAAFFDSVHGIPTKGCLSSKFAGYSSAWSYLGGLALASNVGNGKELYVAEFGAPSSIAVVNLTSSSGKCTMTEATGSPVADPNSNALLSITSFPPRAF